MPSTKRIHSVEVTTSGIATLEEVEELCRVARRVQIPPGTVITLNAMAGKPTLSFAHEFDTEPRPRPSDAVTEQIPPLRPAPGYRQP